MFSIVHDLIWQSSWIVGWLVVRRTETHYDQLADYQLASRMHQTQRGLSSFLVHVVHRVCAAIGCEVFEGPPVQDERLLHSGLMQRGVHRLTEP